MIHSGHTDRLDDEAVKTVIVIDAAEARKQLLRAESHPLLLDQNIRQEILR